MACDCGNPNCKGGDEHLFRRQNRNIEEIGFSVMSVLAGDEGPGFAYTLGLSEKNGHDLIFVGDSGKPVHGYLWGPIKAQLDGGVLTPGVVEPETGINPYRVRMALLPADDLLETHAFGTARRLSRIESEAPPRLLQVVMADLENRFPWEDGYDWLDQLVDADPFEADRRPSKC